MAWAHHLSRHDRNGGVALYSALFVVVCVAAVVALVCATAAAVSVARRVELSARTLRALASMALGLLGLMAVSVAGFVIWWVSESLCAPGVLSNGIGNGFPFASNVLPPTLLVAGVLMLGGLVLALVGAVRIVRALAPDTPPAERRRGAGSVNSGPSIPLQSSSGGSKRCRSQYSGTTVCR